MSSGAGYGQTGGVTEGVRGLNITERSGVSMAVLLNCCNFALAVSAEISDCNMVVALQYGEGTGTTVNQTHNPICDTKYYTKVMFVSHNFI